MRLQRHSIGPGAVVQLSRKSESSTVLIVDLNHYFYLHLGARSTLAAYIRLFLNIFYK